jgi:hypothetical protein
MGASMSQDKSPIQRMSRDTSVHNTNDKNIIDFTTIGNIITIHAIIKDDNVELKETPFDTLVDEINDIIENDYERACTICMEYKKRYLVMPCGHYCLCGKCANKMKECPICIGPIDKLQLVFES